MPQLASGEQIEQYVSVVDGKVPLPGRLRSLDVSVLGRAWQHGIWAKSATEAMMFINMVRREYPTVRVRVSA